MKTPARSDLDAAIAARLSGFPQQAVEKAAQAIFILAPAGDGAPLGKSALVPFFESFGLAPSGNPETLSHALIATAAEQAEAWHLFYPAAFAVWQAQRQAERARSRHGGDTLDELLRGMVGELPDFSPSMLWAEAVRRAKGSDCDALADYNPANDVLTFDHRGTLVDIGLAAFRRRVQRIKKSLRHQPASVASAPDDALHQRLEKAA